MTARIAIGMGSNLEDRLGYLRRAKAALEPVIKHRICSPIYESAALLPENAEQSWDMPFLNLVMTGETALEPLPLLHFLKTLERELGRRERTHWAPREIDLDLLLYGSKILQLPELTVPHPAISGRAFVLQPLCDIAPDLRHPVDGRTISEMACALAEESGTGLVKREDLCLTSLAS